VLPMNSFTNLNEIFCLRMMGRINGGFSNYWLNLREFRQIIVIIGPA
jgi:hypothetical protein